MEKIGEFFCTPCEFLSAAVGRKGVRAGLASTPAAQRQDDFQLRVLVLQRDEPLDRHGIPGIVNMHAIAIEMTKAENDMGELTGREAIDSRASAREIANNGQSLRPGHTACGHKEKKKNAWSWSHTILLQAESNIFIGLKTG
jgi:hypothetical protein